MNLVGIQTKYISPFMIIGTKIGKRKRREIKLLWTKTEKEEEEERDKIIIERWFHYIFIRTDDVKFLNFRRKKNKLQLFTVDL